MLIETKRPVEKSSQMKPIEKKTKEKKKVEKADPQVNKLMSDLNKKFGDNAVVLGSEVVKELLIERIPTGSVELDIALGGGIPIGRYSQIEGAYSSTKTTQTGHVVAQAQKMGLLCAWFDAEGTTDKEYLRSLGVDTEQLLFTRPDGMEECTQMIIEMQRSGVVHLAVIDSLEALTPMKEAEKDMEDSMQMGIKPKMFGEFFRKYQASNNLLRREEKRPFTLIGINQLREKIGAYGNPEYSPGGRAKDFTSSMNLRLRGGDWLAQGKGENKEIVGQIIKFKIDKNKTYKRMQSGEFDFYFAENETQIPVGHNDNFKSIVVQAVVWGLIEKGGSWFTVDRENDIKFQGVDKLVEYLRENPELVDKYKEQILKLAEDVK